MGLMAPYSSAPERVWKNGSERPLRTHTWPV